MTEVQRNRLKNIVAFVAVSLGLFLWYMDGHYWYSGFSKSYPGDWHGCITTAISDATRFDCKEGVITLHMKGTSK